MPGVEDILFEIVQGLKAKGHDVNDETLREMGKAVQNPTFLRMVESGQVTMQQILDESLRGIETVQQRRNRPPGQLISGRSLGPPTATRVQGDQAPIAPMTMEDGRDALFRSNVPIGNQAVGGMMMPGQRPKRTTGVAAMNPVLDDQALLRRQQARRRFPASI